MGEIIQYEGVAYKKVDRKAEPGDVVICRDVSEISSVIANVPHKVLEDCKVHVGNNMRVYLYRSRCGRTRETVDVYERAPEHDVYTKVKTGTIQSVKVYTDPLPIPHVPESKLDNRMRHLEHPFYREARECWQFAQQGQIRKGSEKYPEPFTPSSWTVRELLDHAMQENVDQAHYIYGMYQKVQEMEKELAELRQFRDQVQKTVVKWGAVNEPESGDA